jgi:hypothetical protein
LQTAQQRSMAKAVIGSTRTCISTRSQPRLCPLKPCPGPRPRRRAAAAAATPVPQPGGPGVDAAAAAAPDDGVGSPRLGRRTSVSLVGAWETGAAQQQAAEAEAPAAAAPAPHDGGPTASSSNGTGTASCGALSKADQGKFVQFFRCGVARAAIGACDHSLKFAAGRIYMHARQTLVHNTSCTTLHPSCITPTPQPPQVRLPLHHRPPQPHLCHRHPRRGGAGARAAAVADGRHRAAARCVAGAGFGRAGARGLAQ